MGNRGERRNSVTETEIEDKANVYLNDHDNIEVHVVKGDFAALPEKVKEFIAENVSPLFLYISFMSLVGSQDIKLCSFKIIPSKPSKRNLWYKKF